jgi:6,7-dimethyl-8-ribityllumazine synthase
MSQQLHGRLDGKGVRVALVVSRFNELVTGRLLAGAEDCLERHGGSATDRTVIRVPGAWELSQVAKRVTETGRFDAIIALGAVIRGETPHFDFIAAQVARGLADVGMRSGIPVIFGVLTTDTVEQALDRAGAKTGNKGWDAALSALEMVDLFRGLGRDATK